MGLVNMGKLTTYLFIISFITLGLHFCVPDVKVAEIELLAYLVNPTMYSKSYFFTNFIKVGLEGAIALISALVIGYFSSRPDLAITGGVATYIGTSFFSALLVAYQRIYASGNPFLIGLGLLFIGTMLLVGGLIVIDWWRGRD